MSSLNFVPNGNQPIQGGVPANTGPPGMRQYFAASSSPVFHYTTITNVFQHPGDYKVSLKFNGTGAGPERSPPPPLATYGTGTRGVQTDRNQTL